MKADGTPMDLKQWRKQWSHPPTPIPANATGLWYSEECVDQMLADYAKLAEERERVLREALEQIWKYAAHGTATKQKDARGRQFAAIHDLAIAALAAPEPEQPAHPQVDTGTFACPICGVTHPHEHTGTAIAEWRAALATPAPAQPAKRYRLNSGPCAAMVVDCDCRICRPELEDRPAPCKCALCLATPAPEQPKNSCSDCKRPWSEHAAHRLDPLLKNCPAHPAQPSAENGGQ